MAAQEARNSRGSAERKGPRRWTAVAVAVVTLAGPPAPLARAAPAGDVAWMFNLPGSSRAPDLAHDVLVAEDGSTFLAASMLNGLSPTLFKFDPRGELAWSREFPAPGFNPTQSSNIAPAPGGGVFALSSEVEITHTYSLRRLAADGRELWVRHFSDSRSGRWQLASGADGSTCVVHPTGVRSYDTAGNLLWSRTHPDGGSVSSGVGLDAAGACIVSGFSSGGDFRTGFLRKYDRRGNFVWRRTNALWGNNGAPLAVDGSGNSYLVSAETHSLVKYSPAGEVSWEKRLSSFTPRDIAVDRAGNVLLTGYRFRPAGVAPGYSELVSAAYDPGFQPLWFRPHNLFDSNQTGSGLSADDDGTIVVSGDMQEVRGGILDGFLVAYRPHLAQDSFPIEGRLSGGLWEVRSGAWRVRGGRLVAAAGPVAMTLVSTQAAGEVPAGQIEARVTLPAAVKAPWASLVFAHRDGGYRFLRIARSTISIHEVTPQGSFVRARVRRRTAAGIPLRVRLRLLPDGTAEVYLNGKERAALSWKFSAPAAGRVGFGSGRSGASFDDFALWPTQ